MEPMDKEYETPEKTVDEGRESASMTFTKLLDDLSEEFGKDSDGTKSYTKRMKIKAQLEKRLKLLFPEFERFMIGKRWKKEYHVFKEQDIFEDWQKNGYPDYVDPILDKFRLNLRSLWKKYHKETAVVIVLFSYCLYMCRNECNLSQEEKVSRIQNIVQMFEEVDSKTVKQRTGLCDKIQKKCYHDSLVRTMAKKLKHYKRQQGGDEYRDLIKMVLYITEIPDDKDILNLMKQYSELISIKDHVQSFIEIWQMYLLEESEKIYKRFRDECLFEDDPRGEFLSDTEEQFIRLLFEIVPPGNRSRIDALEKGKWHMVPADLRYQLSNYLDIMKEDMTIINRYIGAFNPLCCEMQILGLATNLCMTQPSYVQANLQHIMDIVKGGILSETYLTLIEKSADKMIRDIDVFDPQKYEGIDYDKYWYLDL